MNRKYAYLLASVSVLAVMLLVLLDIANASSLLSGTGVVPSLQQGTLSVPQALSYACLKCYAVFLYSVNQGDTISSIALHYSLSAANISSYNSNVSSVYPGEQIILPFMVDAIQTNFTGIANQNEYDYYILQYAVEFHLNPMLVKAQVYDGSGFNSNATSSYDNSSGVCGAGHSYGLLQYAPACFNKISSYGITTFYAPNANVSASGLITCIAGKQCSSGDYFVSEYSGVLGNRITSDLVQSPIFGGWNNSVFNPTENLYAAMQIESNDVHAMITNGYTGCTYPQYNEMALGQYQQSVSWVITGCGTMTANPTSYVNAILGWYQQFSQHSVYGWTDEYSGVKNPTTTVQTTTVTTVPTTTLKTTAATTTLQTSASTTIATTIPTTVQTTALQACSGTMHVSFSPNPANPSEGVEGTVTGLSNCSGKAVQIWDYLGCGVGSQITSFTSNSTGGNFYITSPGSVGSYGYYACMGNLSSSKATLSVVQLNTTTSTSTTSSSSVQTSQASTTQATSIATTVATTVSTTTVQQTNSHLQSMINLITWTSANGYSAIDYKAINEISVFHAQLQQGCTIAYDGSAVNVAQTIANAHANGATVTLAVGGAGSSGPTPYLSCLNTAANRTALVNSIVNMVESQGYDGVHVDLEGSFSATDFTLFMQQLSSTLWAHNSNYIIDVMTADWMSLSFNIAAISPYLNHLGIMFNESPSGLANYASELGSSSKVTACYDLSQTSGSALQSALQQDFANGYGVCMWDAALATSQDYQYMQQAGYT